MPERKFKTGKVFLTCCLLILLGVLAYEFVELNRKTPLPPLPNPNGYDDFVKAQNLVTGTSTDFAGRSLEDLHKRVAENAEVLKLVREGLAKQCRIALTFTTNYLDLRSLSDIKRVTRLLEAEGRVAELERRTNDAARIYLETIRYGQESCRGGVMIDHLVGIACETIGVNALQTITGSLEAATCRDLSKQLQEIERRQESLTEVLRNEAEWVRRTIPVWQRIAATIPFASLAKRAQRNFVARCNQSQLPFKRLIIDLAVRAYELDTGQPPKNLDALVPNYLDAVPVDSASGTKLTN